MYGISETEGLFGAKMDNMELWREKGNAIQSVASCDAKSLATGEQV